jgi:hypothetical protein
MKKQKTEGNQTEAEFEASSLEAKVNRWWKGSDLVTLACLVALAVLYQDYMILRQKMKLVQLGR